MPFPKRYAEAAARWRVKAGFVVIAIFFWLARPTWTSLAAGASIGLCGMALRAWAAGHLAKNERLTTSGPFARVRNPLYLGSLTVGVAFAIGSAHAGVAVLLLSYFLLFFLPVVEEEEAHLRKLFPDYTDYAARVPRLLPRWAGTERSEQRFRFSLYNKNREYQALLGFVAGLLLLVVKIRLFG